MIYLRQIRLSFPVLMLRSRPGADHVASAVPAYVQGLCVLPGR